mmetsp:Transcript_44507/g.94714  ORF Transcript_44507/g.94714 Transcript_44507/m.94714 type:complete len:286 (+) Transcript_44507:1467-2324(+)
MEMTKGRGHAQRHACLPRRRSEPRRALARQSSDSSNAEQSGQRGGSRVDLGHVATHRTSAIERHRSRGGNAVEVVVLRRVIGALEHIQHLLSNDESTDDVDGAQRGRERRQRRHPGRVAVRQEVHPAERRGAADGVSHGHERTVQRVRDPEHNLDSDDVREGEGREHGAERRIWADAPHAKDSGAQVPRLLGPHDVGGLVVDDHRLDRLGILLLRRGRRRHGGGPHELSLLHRQHSPNGVILVVDVHVLLDLGCLRPHAQQELGNVVAVQTGACGGQSAGQIRVP